MTPQKKIILCATQRSGSTLFSQDMANTGKLGMPREYFINFPTAKKDELGAQNWRQRIEKIEENCSENGVFCAKVMATQVPYINQRLIDGSRTLSGENIFDAFYEAFEDAVWVFLKREDMIKQAISRSIMNQSRVAHAVRKDRDGPEWHMHNPEYDENYNQEVQYRPQMLKAIVAKINNENLFWEIFFSRKGIKPVRVSYEDYCQDPQFYLSKVAEKIGETVTFQQDKRSLVKLSNSKNAEFYAKFGDAALGEFLERLQS